MGEQNQQTQIALIQKDIGQISKDVTEIKKTNNSILYPLRDWRIIAHYKLNAILSVVGLFVAAAVFHFSALLLEKMFPH